MAWQKRGGGGPILKWKDFPVDGVIEGKFLGVRNGREFQGKMSRLISIEKSDGSGTVSAPANTVIENNVAGVPVGAMIRIVHLGMTSGKAGVEYRNFDIFVDDGGATGLPPGPSVPPTGVAALESKLVNAKGAQVANLMIDALKAKYPDAAAYQKALGDVLKSNGIAYGPHDDEVPF